MTLNTWEISGAVVRMGDLAYKYSRLYNDAKTSESMTQEMSDILTDHFMDELKACRETVRCLKGFSIEWLFNRHGEISQIYVTYNGDRIGLPWTLSTKMER